MYYDQLTSAQYRRHFFRYPHMHGMKPFRIAGNLYFAGDDNVGIHLLDTGDGLIMVDSGYPQMQGFTIESIWELGFRPMDIRIILHTHGHYDHIGATNLIRQLSGAAVCISRADADMMRDRPELICDPRQEYTFTPDRFLEDGDVLRLGNATVHAVAAPGHTMGTMAFFLTVQDGSKSYVAGMPGGVGLNTLSRAYIRRHRLPDMQALFRASLDRLAGEHVDILLGNHTRQNQTPEKYRAMLAHPQGPNPFIDDRQWQSFLRQTSDDFETMRRKECKKGEPASPE